MVRPHQRQMFQLLYSSPTLSIVSLSGLAVLTGVHLAVVLISVSLRTLAAEHL